jgi:hypothetical protein
MKADAAEQDAHVNSAHPVTAEADMNTLDRIGALGLQACCSRLGKLTASFLMQLALSHGRTMSGATLPGLHTTAMSHDGHMAATVNLHTS